MVTISVGRTAECPLPPGGGRRFAGGEPFSQLARSLRSIRCPWSFLFPAMAAAFEPWSGGAWPSLFQTLALHHGDGLLVASGYRGEAERLARLAQGHRVVQEPTARSTYKNVERSLSFFEDADQIAIASDHFHVRRASRYLRQLRPDLSSRLIPAKRRWRNGGWWIQPGGAAYEALLEAKRRIRSAR